MKTPRNLKEKFRTVGLPHLGSIRITAENFETQQLTLGSTTSRCSEKRQRFCKT